MNRKQIFKFISSALGILIGLMMAEVGYRIFHFATQRDLSDLVAGDLPPVATPDTEKTLGQIIQLSAHPRIIYELIPSSTYRFQNALVQTSTLGFRDKEYPKMKEKNTVRIVGLGDSVMFGWGVQEGNCYLAKLENNLNAGDSLCFDIINTAVPGYNTVMELETLQQKIDLTQVDLVLLNFVGNDLDLPNFIRKEPDYLGIKKSFILERFVDNDGIDKNLRSAPFDKVNQSFEQNLEKIPIAYRDMVGEQAFVGAMQELKHLQMAHGFQVIVLSTDHEAVAPQFVKETCQRHSFQLLEIMPFWTEYLVHHPQETWQIAINDGHPSILGHAVIADALEEKIRALF